MEDSGFRNLYGGFWDQPHSAIFMRRPGRVEMPYHGVERE
jgi:hypothetical protein